MELEINGVFNLGSELSVNDFQKKLLIYLESINVSFGGAFYELDESGEKKESE